MYLLRDIATMIVEDGICNELDSDIFTHVKPNEPDNTVVLFEYKGSKVAQFTNTSIRSVQILVRNKRNISASELIWEIYDLLNKKDNIIMIGDKLCLIAIRNTPFQMGIDDKGRYEWVLNLGVTYNNDRKE